MPFSRPETRIDSRRRSIAAFGRSLQVAVLVVTHSIVMLPHVAALQAPTDHQAKPVGTVQATSLLGVELRSLPREAGTDIADPRFNPVNTASERYITHQHDPEAHIDLGVAWAQSWRFQESIRVYTDALERFPDHAALYRHRGHRYISVRRFEDASKDLEKAALLEPRDPEIWYHLGLARYLVADFPGAAAAYRTAWETSLDDESRVAAAHWLVASLRRGGDEKAAQEVLGLVASTPLRAEENRAYMDLLALHAGTMSEEQVLARISGSHATPTSPFDAVTLGYGVANWLAIEGRDERAVEILHGLVESAYWPAFGVIAAEADLARRKHATAGAE